MSLDTLKRRLDRAIGVLGAIDVVILTIAGLLWWDSKRDTAKTQAEIATSSNRRDSLLHVILVKVDSLEAKVVESR